jgi:DNA polymerase III delta prime subunit
MADLWTEKWRPKSLKEYVFKNPTQKKQIENWIKEGALPHLLFSGVQGTGKTTLAKVLFNELNVNAYDIKEINASKDNGVDYVRDSISNFVQTIPFGEYKYVLLDESDYLSSNAQAVLRNLMERYSSNVRFILTCNYPHKIIPAIHSRCQGFHIDKLDKDEFTIRIANILIAESIEFEIDTLDTFVTATYPDLRKCINSIQMNSYGGKLGLPSEEANAGSDYKLEMVALFKEGRYKEARQLICSQISLEEYDDVYKFLYQNLNYFSDDTDKEDKCIITIRDGLVKHTMCADPEINLSATLVELEMISKGVL